MKKFFSRISLLLGLFVLFNSADAWAQNMGITITPSSNPVDALTSLVLTVDVTNTGGGNVTATAVTRTITGLPTGLSGVVIGGAGAANGSYNSATGTVSFTGGPYSLPRNGNGLDFTITFTVPITTTSFTAAGSTTSANRGSDTDNVTVTVNGPPVANNDAATVSYTSTATITVTGNDTAPRGAIDATSVFLSASGGTPTTSRTYTDANGIVFTANATTGTITFTNPNKFVGVATVSYNFKDNQAPVQTSNTGTLTLTLTNTAPVADNDTGGPTNNLTALTNIDVLTGDTDVDGNATIIKASVTLGTQTGGVFTVNTVAGPSEGTVNFTPTAGFVGTASVTYTIQDEKGTVSNAATLSITVTAPPADIYTTLTAPVPNSFANSGATGTFTVTYGNNGPGVAASVTRTAVLNTGVPSTNIRVNGAAPTTTTGTTLTFTTGVPVTVTYTIASRTFNFGTVTNVASGSATSFTFSFTTPATGTSMTTTSNTTISGAVVDNVAGNNSSSVISTLSATSADVQTTIAQTLPVGTMAPAGGFVTYTITTTNLSGSTAATNVVIKVVLTPGAGTLTEVSASNQAAYDNVNSVTFPTIGTLAAGASVSYLVRARIPVNSVSAVTANASSTNDVADPTPGNNNGTASGAMASTTTTQEADIAVTVTGPAQALAGTTTTYNVLVANNGPSNATGVTAQLVFTGNKPASATATGGGGFSYNAGTGVMTFTITGGTVAANSSVPFVVEFTAPTSGSVTATGSTVTATTSTDVDLTNNNGSKSTAALTTTQTASLPQNQCETPGSAGAGTFNNTGLVNTYYPGTAIGTTTLSGATVSTVTVGTPVGTTLIAAGDLVVIMQMQGAVINATNTNAYGDGVSGAPANGHTSTTAGRYEYATVSSRSGSTITLTTLLVNPYVTAAATATDGQKTFQVIRVPRYQSFTMTANMTNVPAWNGATGGVLVLDVAGQLALGGNTIDLQGKGFRGGGGRQLAGGGGAGTDYRTLSTAGTNGSKGEGIAGTPRYLNNGGVLLDNGVEGYPDGSYGRGAASNAGGGGTDSNPGANDENTGGGGGSNAGSGGRGGDAWQSDLPYGGEGGAPFLEAAPSRLIMGGGGGAATSNNGTGIPAAGFASSGAAGGGIVLMRASTVTGTGTINVSGADMTYIPANDASGGGGGGGSVLIIANNSLSNVTVLAKGGFGGSNTTANSGPHGPGGGGSGGTSFTSSALSASSSFTGGVNGTTLLVNFSAPNGSNSIDYGATEGTTSTPPNRVNVTIAETPLIQSSANCVADVKTTISGPTTMPSRSTGTFTATYTNDGAGTASTFIRRVTLPVGAIMTSAQQAALVAAYPGTTYTAPPNAATPGSIVFTTESNVVANTTYTRTFDLTVFKTTANNGSATIISTTNSSVQGTNQGSDVGANTASQALTITDNGPLPVELASFTTQVVKNVDAQLNWRTASEKNNDHFDIERSLTGTEFVKIGQVRGQGTTTSLTDYALTDAGIGVLARGLVYYRLRQVDTDGQTAYSPVRSLSFGPSAGKLAIGLVPNPAAGGTSLDLTQMPSGTYQVSLVDAMGRVVRGLRLSAGQTHLLDLRPLASGTYTVLVRGESGGQVVHLAKRLVKQ